MGQTLEKLLEEAGSDAGKAVHLASKRWRQQVRELISSLTGFRLSQRAGWERDQFGVPVRVKPGLPKALQSLSQDKPSAGDDEAIELIGLWGQDIEALRSACNHLNSLCLGLACIPGWEQRGTTYGEVFHRAEDVAAELAQLVKRAKLLKRILGLDEDVLGAYFPRQSGGEIHLYWLVIGATARLLGVTREGLTLVVLAHEMAHAYTLSGMDIDGRRWEAKPAARAVAEAIAQYYTHKLAEALTDRGFSELWPAYEALLAHQHEIYKAHTQLDWTNRFTPEVLRSALMYLRRSDSQIDMVSFSELLEDHSSLLSSGQNARRT